MEILYIRVQDIGHIYATKTEPIEVFTKNGEMAPVEWYRHGLSEYNGKYVLKVQYKNSLTSTSMN